MGKKRKASGHSQKAAPAQEQSSKLVLNSWEDVADSEDEFLLNREQILLDEGPEVKRRRKAREEEKELEVSDEEILALPESDDDDIGDDIDDYGEQYDEDGDVDMEEREPQSSSENESAGRRVEESEDEGWGNSRQDYYGADAIETEQAALEEEAEAKRLQQKQLQAMTEADFGFDETWEEAQQKEGPEFDTTEAIVEVLPELQIPEDTSPAERLKILKNRYPEFEPLSREFVGLQTTYEEMKAAALAATKNSKRDLLEDASTTTASTITVLRYQALSAYLGILATYFALMTSTATANGSQVAISPAKLRDHAVMDSLVKSRSAWFKAKSLKATKRGDSAVKTPALAISESAILELPAQQVNGHQETAETSKSKRTKAEAALEAAKSASTARRAKRLEAMEADLASLSALASTADARAREARLADKARHAETDQSGKHFGDETDLTPQEAADKAKRRRTMRFYTSQIVQTANKRGAARDAQGGDADIPLHKTLRERREQWDKEAEKKKVKKEREGKKGNAELGGNSDDEDRRTAAEVRGDAPSDSDDYQTLASKARKSKSASKAQKTDAFAAANGLRTFEVEEIGADGKRKVTRQIEKNQGLKPFRKKDVRNPRVKKRKKYAEKMKKIKSTKPVYDKKREGKGGYKGELTGITSLVKSRKL